MYGSMSYPYNLLKASPKPVVQIFGVSTSHESQKRPETDPFSAGARALPIRVAYLPKASDDKAFFGIFPRNHGIGPFQAVVPFMPGLCGVFPFNLRIPERPPGTEGKIAAQAKAVGIMLGISNNGGPFGAEPFLPGEVMGVEGFVVEPFPVQRVDPGDLDTPETVLLHPVEVRPDVLLLDDPRKPPPTGQRL